MVANGVTEDAMTVTGEEQTMTHSPPLTQDSDTAPARISFPYENLDEAIRLAETIHSNDGASCELTQLAAWLGTTRSSSKFRGQVLAAKMFGLIEPRNKLASLTELGTAIADPRQRDSAKVKAFLEVPLYRMLHDKFAGRLLPPDESLEAEMCSLGVSDKSVAKARQVFQRSASSAGLFRAGQGRLARPLATDHGFASDAAEAPGNERTATNPDPLEQKLTGPSDPLLIGLWSQLPGSRPFPPQGRKHWLELMRLALDWVYGEESEMAAPAETTSSKPPVPTSHTDNTEPA